MANVLRVLLQRLTDPAFPERATVLDSSDRLYVHRDGDTEGKFVRPALVVPDGSITNAKMAASAIESDNISQNDMGQRFVVYKASTKSVTSSWTDLSLDKIITPVTKELSATVSIRYYVTFEGVTVAGTNSLYIRIIKGSTPIDSTLLYKINPGAGVLVGGVVAWETTVGIATAASTSFSIEGLASGGWSVNAGSRRAIYDYRPRSTNSFVEG